MQNKTNQHDESGKVQLGLLLAVALAAGSAGVWSEIKAATNVDRVTSRSVTADGGSAWGEVSENGDGTAWVSATVDDGSTWAQGIDPASTAYSISGEIQPGQSGRASGSGSAVAQVAGRDFFTGDVVLLDISVAVSGATDVTAEIVQTVSASRNPITGESSINRVHRVGNNAVGMQAGSLDILANGTPIYSSSGILGIFSARTVNTVTQIK